MNGTEVGPVGSQLVEQYAKQYPVIRKQYKLQREDRPYYETFRLYLEQRHRVASEANDGRGTYVYLLTGNTKIREDIHSHNDYAGSLPLFLALSYGVASVEADCWLTSKQQLLVSHKRAFINKSTRSLSELYLDPLMAMLDEVNSGTEDALKGVFHEEPGQTLQLLIDFKNGGPFLYQVLMSKYMKPLIDRGYLTYFDYNEQKLTLRPITLVLTGGYPRDATIIDGSSGQGYFGDFRRYAFADVPILDARRYLEEYNLGPPILASDSFRSVLGKSAPALYSMLVVYLSADHQLPASVAASMTEHIAVARELGFKTRLWGAPSLCPAVRKGMWEQQKVKMRVDTINVDEDNIPNALKVVQH